jgi:uncharacterized membrane protein YqjE
MGAPATDVGNHHEAPTVTSALDRMVDAAEKVVVDQVRLARLEAEAAVARTVRDGAVIGLGGIVLLVAWTFGMVALHALLIRYLDPAASLGIIAGVNGVVGAALVAFGLSRGTGSARETAHGTA